MRSKNPNPEQLPILYFLNLRVAKKQDVCRDEFLRCNPSSALEGKKGVGGSLAPYRQSHFPDSDSPSAKESWLEQETLRYFSIDSSKPFEYHKKQGGSGSPSIRLNHTQEMDLWLYLIVGIFDFRYHTFFGSGQSLERQYLLQYICPEREPLSSSCSHHMEYRE